MFRTQRTLMWASVLVMFEWTIVLGGEPLSGTCELTVQGDLAAEMVTGIDRFLTSEIAGSVARRDDFWKRDYSSVEAYRRSIEGHRPSLRRIIGVVDPRTSNPALEYISSPSSALSVACGDGYEVRAVRWRVMEGMEGEGLLLLPNQPASAGILALPDADWTPEMLVGLAPGVSPEAQFARRLAENGCMVLVPMLLDRTDTFSGSPHVRMVNQPHREFIYRMAYEVGRHVIGYEVQKVLAGIDVLLLMAEGRRMPVGIIGYGEGGLLALYSAALDTRIEATVVSGYFGAREGVWSEPIYRNVWSLLREFGDAELAGMVAPRMLIIGASQGPWVDGPPKAREGRSGAAPGRLAGTDIKSVEAEFQRAKVIYDRIGAINKLELTIGGTGQPGTEPTIASFLSALNGGAITRTIKPNGVPPTDSRKGYKPQGRLQRQFNQMIEFTQRLVRQSHFRREEFWSKADASSIEKWQTSCRFYRQYLWEEVIGRLPSPTMPANPRTRLILDQPRWRGYEVMLDVWPGVFAYGVLLVPKDLKAGERRPVVVCQHGLEGRPTDVVDPKIENCYHTFGAKLADRGFIVYAPQNPYIGEDRFRMIQRKANPLKLSLFSFIIGQHERTLEWLASLPFVDGGRMAFYGLSYGGKTAVRVPPILERYCLSICSGDFNEWIYKNTNMDHAMSYMFTGEWEMPEFDLGNTFNYAEMASLMVPRPFMVERGHDDGVALDEWVAWEYAKVRRLYDRLGIGDRTAIEFFNGVHQISGKGTFEFLEHHLRPGK